ncbi:RNA polymerase subunit sigma-24 [Imperialibacter sp. EC-SDR9]|nr:RNA polymerase subunit sigma-24 [Imperialibacter sp. 89]CAD5265277.1 RNA polymerase subunit sigma-24 [Imperialibacter sp. 75]VVT03160.1 RNA polymerase subunit sigma-24 [Imperialibacter sp. EC-SDR9]
MSTIDFSSFFRTFKVKSNLRSSTYLMNEPVSLTMTERRSQNIAEALKQYGKRLFGFIRSRVRTLEEAEDITQEVWYQFSNLVDVESIEQVNAWLFRVARNKITDNYRKKKVDLLDDQTFEDDGDGDYMLRDLLPSEEDVPELENLKEIFRKELFAALEELPVNQQQVFIWNEIEDMTFQEMSDLTGENIKTLISRKRYAVQHLRKKLLPLYNELMN